MTRSSLSSITVGVVGVGNVTTTFHLPILSDLSQVEISYVADVNGKRARTFASIYGGSPISIDGDPSDLPQTDVILLATPVGVRKTYVNMAAETDAGLFAEKPFAIDETTHREYLDRLSEPTTCNYMRTTYSTIQQLATLIESEAFGAVESVNMSRGLVGSTGIRPGSFRTDSEMSGGGVLMEKGCHELSQIVELFGDGPIEVVHSDVTWRESLDVAVKAQLYVGHPYDIDIDFRISMVEPYETLATVEFERATVRFEHPEAGESLRISVNDGDRGIGNNLIIEQTDQASQTTEEAMYLRWRSFLDGLDDGSYDAEAETYLEVSQLIQELYEQADSPPEVTT